MSLINDSKMGIKAEMWELIDELKPDEEETKMTMTMKEHMEMMDRIRQGKNAELSKIKTVKINGGINGKSKKHEK